MSRTEHIALGISDVNMPMLYGEEERAFLRLQEEITKTQTIIPSLPGRVLILGNLAYLLLAPKPSAKAAVWR